VSAAQARRALITGISGQDGSYLAELLLEKGYEVHGLLRRSAEGTRPRLAEIEDHLHLHHGDLLDEGSLRSVLRDSRPNEVYNLAAMSSVSQSWQMAVATAENTAIGVTKLLEAIRNETPDARYYQASSSEMFGRAVERPQSERTAFYPRSPYGVAKVYAHFITVNYRESFGLHANSGILFNHESPRRSPSFVSRRITQGVAAIKQGRAEELVLGDLSVKRDWGFAKEYVEAMWLMLQQDEPGDYVIGSGVSHSVRDIVDRAFAHVDLDPDAYIRQDPKLTRPADIEEVVADASKARDELGWVAQTDFDGLIAMMVDADLQDPGL
jgi:GDPmannose 4,6-dehydratase